MLSIKKLLAKLLSFLVTDESVTISISTTVGSLSAYQAIRSGNVVQLTLRVSRSGSTAIGSSAYEGTINTTGLRPLAIVTSGHYYGNRAMTGDISTNGKIVIRNTGTTAINNMDSHFMSFTYIVK